MLQFLRPLNDYGGLNNMLSMEGGNISDELFNILFVLEEVRLERMALEEGDERKMTGELGWLGFEGLPSNMTDQYDSGTAQNETNEANQKFIKQILIDIANKTLTYDSQKQRRKDIFPNKKDYLEEKFIFIHQDNRSEYCINNDSFVVVWMSLTLMTICAGLISYHSWRKIEGKGNRRNMKIHVNIDF